MVKIKKAKDLNGDSFYFASHAQATFLDDGSTVQDQIEQLKQITDNYISPDLSDCVTHEQLSEVLITKQDVIEDLNDIRDGAASGKSALQRNELASVAFTNNYLDLGNTPHIPTAEDVEDWGFVNQTLIAEALDSKVDKIDGKVLSTNDFTDVLKLKLESLENYNDSEIQLAVETLRESLDTLTNGNTTQAIESFNEIISFLDKFEDKDSLDSIILGIQQQIESKQDILISGENISTINGKSLLEGDDINIEPMVSITYSELKSLRDEEKLVPGQKYRITDYVTIANESNIKSAGHPFNIIVEALNENTLSERAKTIQDENDEYFDSEKLKAWDLWYCLDNDADRFDWGVYTVYDSSSCVINSNLIDGNTFKTPFAFSGYMWNDPINGDEYESKVENDLIYEWGFEEEPNGNKSLYLLKSDVDIYNEEGTVDTNDKFYYRGVIEADGTEYDCWQKYETDENGYENGYILGTEATRFTHFALTERIVEGNIIELQNGKGIIYRMIDEYGNDCPYDFKNIMFKRPNAEEDDNYYFTFSWVEEDGNIIDASISGNNGYLLDDVDEIPGVFSNVIGKYIENGVNKLPVNIFISNYNYDGCYYGCRNNSFGDNCCNNEFGNYCNNNEFGNGCGEDGGNSFGDDCYNNIFGNECNTNTFGNNCYGNRFGNYCHDNSFGNDCYYNSFGEGCNGNTFGECCDNNTFVDNCSNNILGNNCGVDGANSFGNYCNNNTFGNYCNDNSFGDGFYNNSLGNECGGNTFGTNCRGNTFGTNCHTNTFGKGCISNTFDNSCENNTFGIGCISNTFGYNCYDNSFGDDCSDNSFGKGCSTNSFGNSCNNNTFGNGCFSNTLGEDCYSNEFGNKCHTNTFGTECKYNSFGDKCHTNTFGTECKYNSFGDNCCNNEFGNYCNNNEFGNGCGEDGGNSLGNDCENNTFGNGCYSNTLGENCNYNIFGDDCGNNSFGNYCYNNLFGNDCGGEGANSFGNECSNNSFCTNCYKNSFGNDCSENTFGNYCFDNILGRTCNYNTFGNYCYDNSFGNNCINNSFGNECYENNFEGIFLRNNYMPNNCNNIIISGQTDEDHYIQNLVISKGISNTQITIPDSLLNADYEIKVAKNSSGELKIYCEADLIA